VKSTSLDKHAKVAYCRDVHFTEIGTSSGFTAYIAPRIMHLVGVENLCGSAKFSTAQALGIRRAYAAVAPVGAREMTVLVTSHFAAPQAWMAWPSAGRRLVRSGADGADGADLALLDVIDPESLHLRFDHVVIGSDDGIFALAASQLQLLGYPGTVVSRRAGLSQQLRLAVRNVLFIDEPVAVAALRSQLGHAA
jgi:hypothetical protein